MSDKDHYMAAEISSIVHTLTIPQIIYILNSVKSLTIASRDTSRQLLLQNPQLVYALSHCIYLLDIVDESLLPLDETDREIARINKLERQGWDSQPKEAVDSSVPTSQVTPQQQIPYRHPQNIKEPRVTDPVDILNNVVPAPKALVDEVLKNKEILTNIQNATKAEMDTWPQEQRAQVMSIKAALKIRGYHLLNSIDTLTLMPIERIKKIISKLSIRGKIPLIDGKIDTSELSEIDSEFINLFKDKILLYKRGFKEEISSNVLINICLKVLVNINYNKMEDNKIILNFIKECLPKPEYSKYDKELNLVDKLSNELNDMEIRRPIRKVEEEYKIDKLDNIIVQNGWNNSLRGGYLPSNMLFGKESKIKTVGIRSVDSIERY